MKRSVNVFLYDKFCGVLIQDCNQFLFEYDRDYCGKPISLSMPISGKRFESERLHPFFESLAPEGWLRERYCTLQHLDDDSLTILIENGRDLIGAVRLEFVE